MWLWHFRFLWYTPFSTYASRLQCTHCSFFVVVVVLFISNIVLSVENAIAYSFVCLFVCTMHRVTWRVYVTSVARWIYVKFRFEKLFVLRNKYICFVVVSFCSFWSIICRLSRRVSFLPENLSLLVYFTGKRSVFFCWNGIRCIFIFLKINKAGLF